MVHAAGMKIRREAFIALINETLSEVPQDANTEASLLAVARTATSFARGNWTVNGCGCPMHQATGRAQEGVPAHKSWAILFDAAMFKDFGPGEYVVEVLDN